MRYVLIDQYFLPDVFIINKCWNLFIFFGIGNNNTHNFYEIVLSKLIKAKYPGQIAKSSNLLESQRVI